MKLVKELTIIYIRLIKGPKKDLIPQKINLINLIRDALVEAQQLLTPQQLSQYKTWHQKKWPNLDW